MTANGFEALLCTLYGIVALYDTVHFTNTHLFACFAAVIVEFVKPFYVVAEGESTSVCVSKAGDSHIPLSVVVFSCPNVMTGNWSTADGECTQLHRYASTHTHIHTQCKYVCMHVHSPAKHPHEHRQVH